MKKLLNICLTVGLLLLLQGCGRSDTKDDIVNSVVYTTGMSFRILPGQSLNSLVEGTTFSIETDAETGESTVSITEGSVEVI